MKLKAELVPRLEVESLALTILQTQQHQSQNYLKIGRAHV